MIEIQILVGLLTAVFLVFLRSAVLKAHKQKIVAARLSSYLEYWKNCVLEYDLFSVFYLGIEWNKEVSEIISNGGSGSELVELEKSKKSKLSELKEALENGELELPENLCETVFNRLPEDPLIYIASEISKTQQNIVDGKTFVSDEDVSNLDVLMARTTIELKMEVISLLGLIVGLLILMHKNQGENISKICAEDISKLVWKGIIISKHIDRLCTRLEFYQNRTIFELTTLNMKNAL